MLAKLNFTWAVLQWSNPLRMFFRRFRKADVSLIDENDLANLLKEIGRFHDLTNGELHCSQCAATLTLENLAGFIVRDGNYAFLCDSQVCLSRVHHS